MDSAGGQLTRMVRLHALQCMHKRAMSLEVQLLRLGDDGTLYAISRPEGMSHRTPRIPHIGAEQGLAVLARLEARRHPCDDQIDNAVLVGGRLDRVLGAIVRQRYGEIIGVEG